MTRIGVEFGPRPKPQIRGRNRKRNDAPWREECLTARGRYCRACPGPLRSGVVGYPPKLEIDHIWPRSQGGPSVVENGLVLCDHHHREKTDSRLRIQFDWLDPDQVAWLQTVGWVWWDADGLPNGRGMNHFEPRPSRPSK